eukprot:jgi/Tetstr1/427924/TSEL_017999.t1
MAEEDGAMNTVIVKSKIDNRYSADEIVTHDGCRRPCYAVSTLAELRKVLGDKQYQDVQVVAIDEGQFFDDLREYCQAAQPGWHRIRRECDLLTTIPSRYARASRAVVEWLHGTAENFGDEGLKVDAVLTALAFARATVSASTVDCAMPPPGSWVAVGINVDL